MPAHALTTASSMTCPHGGAIVGTPRSPRMKAGGAPVLTADDTFQIVGCAFTLPNGKPSPCVAIAWVKVDRSAKVDGAATLSTASVGLCKAETGAPQGPVVVQATQAAAWTS